MRRNILITALFVWGIVSVNAQSILKDDFLTGYSIGDVLEKGVYTSTSDVELMPNQWNLTGRENDKSAENPKIIKGLSYKKYPQKDPAIELGIADGTRISVYSFDQTYRKGTYYLAFLLNISKAGKNAQDILAFDSNFTGNTARCKLFVSSENRELKYSISVNGGRTEAGITTNTYAQGSTYLLVMKYDLDAGTVALFVDPKISDKEPTPDATYSNPEATSRTIRAIQLKQRKSVKGSIGGFRFADNWKDAIGAQ